MSGPPVSPFHLVLKASSGWLPLCPHPFPGLSGCQITGTSFLIPASFPETVFARWCFPFHDLSIQNQETWVQPDRPGGRTMPSLLGQVGTQWHLQLLTTENCRGLGPSTHNDRRKRLKLVRGHLPHTHTLQLQLKNTQNNLQLKKKNQLRKKKMGVNHRLGETQVGWIVGQTCDKAKEYLN